MAAVAFVTYRDLLALSVSDQLLQKPLVDQGIQVVPVSWDDPETDWRQFDAVILRSCWDYHKRPDEFRQWIKKLIELDVPVYNSPQTVLWNYGENLFARIG